MCVRMQPLTFQEAQDALLSREQTGRARVAPSQAGFDAYPKAKVPAYVMGDHGGLVTVQLDWGFPLQGSRRLVYNTRIETALGQLAEGRGGFWADAIANGRCLVPVRGFYEGRVPQTEGGGEDAGAKPSRRQYRFRMPGAAAFLLAGVCRDGRLSIVTTAPNAQVAQVHDWMPLVLGPGESGIWLGPDFASLADRSRIFLSSEAEA